MEQWCMRRSTPTSMPHLPSLLTPVWLVPKVGCQALKSKLNVLRIQLIYPCSYP